MSSFMRTIERGKIRTTMENEGETKVNKKLKPWWNAYKEKKAEYLKKLAEKGYKMETRKEYEKRIRRKR